MRMKWLGVVAAMALTAAVAPVDIDVDGTLMDGGTTVAFARAEAACVTCWPKSDWTCTNGVRKEDDHCDTATPACIAQE